MGDVSFYLVNKKNIVASYYCEDERMIYSTGCKSEPTEFSKNEYPKSIKKKLLSIEEAILQYVDHCGKIGKSVLAGELKQELTSQFKVRKHKEPLAAKSFFEDWEEMLSNMSSGNLLHHQDKRYSDRSVEHYQSVLWNMMEFEKWLGRSFTYADWDWRLHGKLMQYCVEMNYTKNTIFNITKDLRGFLRITHSAGKHRNLIFKEPGFLVMGEDTDQISLSTEEIGAIYKLDLSKDKFADNARDCFVLACYVGLRISDLRRLTPQNFGKDHLEVDTGKTDEKVIIPLHWIVREIWEKYNGGLPIFKTPESLKYHIVDICKEAGIVNKVLVGKTTGGVMKREYKEKCQLVSAHTTRRSFATNGYLAGIPILDLMKITGHKTIESFLKYIRISKEENARRLATHPFFNKPTDN